jgi:muramidase (phage lysozyme)
LLSSSQTKPCFPSWLSAALGSCLIASPAWADSSALRASLADVAPAASPLQVASSSSSPLNLNPNLNSAPELPRSLLALLDQKDGHDAEGGGFRFAITPERRALLNTIRYAEGTWARGQDLGYRVMFGGGLMPGLDRHPDRVIYSGRYASAAAGAYQFMPFTWSMASQKLGLAGFGPHVQDQAAIFLIQRRGALQLADRGEFTPELAAKLAPEWASFPTLAGYSYYGQPVKRFTALKAFYERSLAQLKGLAQPSAPIALAPPCVPETSLRCRLQSLDRIGPKPKSLGL